MRFDISTDTKISLNTAKRATQRSAFAKKTRSLDADNASVCIHPVIDAKGAGGVAGAEARQGIVIPQGFMGNLGASPRRALRRGRGGRGETGSKIENEHKKHKKRGAGQIAAEHSSAKGQFIFVCYINFLLRLLASADRLLLVSASPSPAARHPARVTQATNLRSIRAFHPLKPLTPPDIKGNAN